jgi:hypothetical protein
LIWELDPTEAELARYELTMSNGEKILVDHSADGMDALLSIFESKDFVPFGEVKVGSAGARDIIVASEHVALIRSLGDESQGSLFRPKR